MCGGHRPGNRVKVIALAALTAVALTLAASAQARGLRPGLRSTAPSQRALSQALAQTTGLSPSQVTSEDICPTAARGHARCAGQALILRSNHALVRPHAPRHSTLGRVKPAFMPGFATPATTPAATPPLPGTPAYLQQAYDLAYLSQTGGTHNTIAIVDPFSNPNAESDLATYRAQYELPACTTTQRLLQEGQSERQAPRSADSERDLGKGGIARPRRRLGALPEVPHPAGRGQRRHVQRPGQAARNTASELGATQISASWTVADSSGFLSDGSVRVPRDLHRRGHRGHGLSQGHRQLPGRVLRGDRRRRYLARTDRRWQRARL